MKKIYITSMIFISTLICSAEQNLISNESYITGNDGVIRMYVNIMGHVENPGLYLVYDKIHILSALGIAGGYKQGADLNNLIIYRKNGGSDFVNLYDVLDDTIQSEINLYPHDTIYIKEKTLSRFFMSSNLPSIILSLINVLINLEDSKNN